jgi:hypothetical protein
VFKIVGENYFLGYNALQSVKSQLQFRRNIFKAEQQAKFYAAFLLGFLFNSEDVGEMLLRIVD